MRINLASVLSNATLITIVALPGVATAQDASAPPKEPTAAVAVAASDTPAAAPSATTTASATVAAAPAESTGANAQAPTAAPETKAAEPEQKSIPSYVRLDHDYMFGLQLWAGATYPITDTFGIATDIYVAENYVTAGDAGATQSWWGEFDIGPALTLGPLSLTPMAGIAFDWVAKRPVALNAPQLYTILNLDKVYFESWIWTVLYSPFNEPAVAGSDYFHTRNWLLYKASSVIGLGPQFELTTNLNSKVYPKGITAMPLGGHVELAYGTGNSLGLFLGYELDKDTRQSAGNKGVVGRLTFVHNF